MTRSHSHSSPNLQIGAVQWPHPTDDPSRITLNPGDWMIHGIVRAPVADASDPDALRRLLEFALATLDHHAQGADALLDDHEA